MTLQRTSVRFVTSLAVATAVALVVAGCGKKDKAATQVVASVDGEEITVQQINGVLAKARGVTPENLSKAKADILSGLVEQQLAINLASSKKLDRTPEVVAALEAARREILARAALEQIVANQTKPTDEEAQKYYAAHPELFSQRRIFNLQEIALSKNTPGIDDIRAQVASTKSIEDMAAWLKARKVEFSANAGVRPAEQVPLEVLPKLHAFKDGQMGLIEGKDGYIIMRVAATRSQPVAEAQALPTIKVFLANQSGTAAVKLAKDEMKTKAKIEYFGEFAGGEAAFKAKAEAETKAAAEAAVQAKAKAVANADAATKAKADEQAAALADQEARSKARADARAQASKDKSNGSKPTVIDLEKGIKGLK